MNPHCLSFYCPLSTLNCAPPGVCITYWYFYKSLVRGTPCSCGHTDQEGGIQNPIGPPQSACGHSSQGRMYNPTGWQANARVRRCPIQTLAVAGPIFMVLMALYTVLWGPGLPFATFVGLHKKCINVDGFVIDFYILTFERTTVSCLRI